MEGLAVTCPLAPNMSHLILSSCSSPRDFALDFLQTLPRDNALVLSLTFGSANTWYEDLHLASQVPCPAHTSNLTGCPKPVRCSVGLGNGQLCYGFIPIIGKAATRHIGHAAAQIEPPAIAAEGPSKSTLVV